jgi:hypothetical protein
VARIGAGTYRQFAAARCAVVALLLAGTFFIEILDAEVITSDDPADDTDASRYSQSTSISR